MKCFEITINGERVCTAGVGDSGVLNGLVSLIQPNQPAESAGTEIDKGPEMLSVTVSGIANRDDANEHLDWLHRDLEVGDEVVIRIIEASSCDEPQGKQVSYLACSFCEKKQMEVSKLIAGPAVFICNECVGDCKDAMEHGEPTGKITIVVRDKAQASCSFCGRKPDEVDRIVGVPTAHICSECLVICENILADDVED